MESNHTGIWAKVQVIYAIGLLLAIGGCGSLFLVEGNWVYATSLVYVVGLVLIWTSRTSTFNKWIAVIIPTVIFTSVYTIARDDRVREPAKWLVPHGYSGPAYVFLKEKKCGQEVQQEEDFRMYTFDTSGILLSKFDKNFGKAVISSQYYYVLPDGERKKLISIMDLSDTIKAPDYAIRDSTGQPIFAFPGEAIQGDAESGRYYLEYTFIGSYKDYVTFARNSTLPDSADSGLLAIRIQKKENCH